MKLWCQLVATKYRRFHRMRKSPRFVSQPSWMGRSCGTCGARSWYGSVPHSASCTGMSDANREARRCCSRVLKREPFTPAAAAPMASTTPPAADPTPAVAPTAALTLGDRFREPADPAAAPAEVPVPGPKEGGGVVSPAAARSASWTTVVVNSDTKIGVNTRMTRAAIAFASSAGKSGSVVVLPMVPKYTTRCSPHRPNPPLMHT